MSQTLLIKSLATVGVAGTAAFSGVAISNSLSSTSTTAENLNKDDSVSLASYEVSKSAKKKIIANADVANYTWNTKCRFFHTRNKEYCVALANIMKHLQKEFAKQFTEIRK